MNNDEFILIDEYEISIRDGKIEIPGDIINKINELPDSEAKISIYRRVDEMLNEFNVEKEKFYAIRNAQKIPDKIALDFLSVKGEIHDIDFLKRLKGV